MLLKCYQISAENTSAFVLNKWMASETTTQLLLHSFFLRQYDENTNMSVQLFRKPVLVFQRMHGLRHFFLVATEILLFTKQKDFSCYQKKKLNFLFYKQEKSTDSVLLRGENDKRSEYRTNLKALKMSTNIVDA